MIVVDEQYGGATVVDHASFRAEARHGHGFPGTNSAGRRRCSPSFGTVGRR